ncbi:MAG: sel1 repeat family protein [Nitrospira sp. CG24E]|nr:MAG: sel1 repeat family protein [Nitrospira sp. CG24E]
MKRMTQQHRKCATKKPGAHQHYAELFNQYCKLAERGDASGQFELGMMFLYGQGVPQSEQEAAVWFRKAAEQGHAGAQAALVLCMSADMAPCKTIRKPAPRTIRPLNKESSSGQHVWA